MSTSISIKEQVCHVLALFYLSIYLFRYGILCTLLIICFIYTELYTHTCITAITAPLSQFILLYFTHSYTLLNCFTILLLDTYILHIYTPTLFHTHTSHTYLFNHIYISYTTLSYCLYWQSPSHLHL